MKAAYQTLIDSQILGHDKAQLNAVDALATLANKLERTITTRPNENSKIHSSNGLYFHGRVGRGKTMLMDLFYQKIDIKQKKRVHFHRFMENVHQQLNKLTVSAQKIDNPLNYIAKQWAKELRLLCFDEFYITDIADAMLIHGILTALFEQGVVLVATSNCKPEHLYQYGLLRERFLPTIALIKKHCDIVAVDGELDHRLSTLQNECNSTNRTNIYRYYYFPLAVGNSQLKSRSQQLISSQSTNHQGSKSILINNRKILFIARDDKTIFFDFFELCSGPRSQRDYMKIADKFSCVLIANVPKFSGKLIPAVFSGVEDSYQRSGILLSDLRQLDDEARRFIALVDEFYDQAVQLILSAEVDITQLYQGEQLAFEFARCQSRLFEMQQADHNIP